MKEDVLLVRFLLGEVTDSERIEVQSWLDTSEGNRTYFEELKFAWEKSAIIQPTSVPDKYQAWRELQDKIQIEQRQPHPIWIKVAAAILTIVATGIWLTFYVGRETKIVTQIASDVQTTILPDGSAVTLSNNSQISYPEHFEKEQRHVQFLGKGYFNVQPDQNRPFIINIDDLVVKVLGTSFFINNDSTQTTVEVRSGRVLVKRRGQGVILEKGELLSVKRGDPDMRVKRILDFDVPISNKSVNPKVIIGSEELKDLPKMVRQGGGDSIIVNDITLDSLITKMIKNGQLAYHTSAEIDSLERKQHEDIVQAIIRDLLSDEIFTSEKSIKSFRITEKLFVVNGRPLSSKIHGKYKSKFAIRKGYGVYYGREVPTSNEGFHLDRINP